MLNVLNVKQENHVYFINVSDYVAVNNNENASAMLDDNAKLTLSKGR